MTLSFNYLGNYGHIGNQMFQYAALKGIAISNQVDYVIPPREVFGTQYPLMSKLDDCFNLECNRGISDFDTYEEKSFEFDSNLMNGVISDLNLHGYFQTEKYFSHCKDEIRKDFTFNPEILEPCKEMVSSFDELISLHLRRTDYVTNENYHVQPLSYYEVGLSLIGVDCPVLVFSDDPEWCKSQEFFSDDRFMISESKDPYIDMCLMNLCSYHVTSNSSYSWWGAWLADSKKVISPKNWFMGNAINNDTSDLYCSNWIIL
jgi:hypothetical protein